MNPARNSNKNPSVFAEFSCQLDDRLTLIDPSPKLAELLGFVSPEMPEALLSHLSPAQIAHNRKKVISQLDCGNDVEINFSSAKTAIGNRWLLARGQRYFDTGLNMDTLRGVLVDVTQSKEQYDTQVQFAAQYHIILEQTGEIMFNWDVQHDTITFSNEWNNKFGFIPQTDRFTEAIAQSNNIHPEDAKELLLQFMAMRSGSSFLDFDIRIAATKSEWLWCKVRACGIYNAAGRLDHIVGLIIDIDDEKKKHRALQARAEQDSLTRLLNAHTTRVLVEQYLHSCADHVDCAMLIVDLDDFKRINDRYGHLCGDHVLLAVANVLQNSFRANDIVGRIGGEEFLVLMKNVADQAKILERCRHLLEAIRASSSEYTLTASIGVCIVSGESPMYDELFSRADTALYEAKREGKNRYALSQ